jgi:hypothetical protein
MTMGDPDGSRRPTLDPRIACTSAWPPAKGYAGSALAAKPRGPVLEAHCSDYIRLEKETEAEAIADPASVCLARGVIHETRRAQRQREHGSSRPNHAVAYWRVARE